MVGPRRNRLHPRGGYWLTPRLEKTPRDEVTKMVETLACLMRDGRLTLPVDRVFDLQDWRAAISKAQEEGRSGKVLLKLSGND